MDVYLTEGLNNTYTLPFRSTRVWELHLWSDGVQKIKELWNFNNALTLVDTYGRRGTINSLEEDGFTVQLDTELAHIIVL